MFAANSNLAYFIELTTALECQKQLLMSSISNLGGRESLEIAVIVSYTNIYLFSFYVGRNDRLSQCRFSRMLELRPTSQQDLIITLAALFCNFCIFHLI